MCFTQTPLSALNTTARAKLDILFFNRVGKTGSEMVNGRFSNNLSELLQLIIWSYSTYRHFAGLIELLAQDEVNNFNLYYPGKLESRMSWLTLKKEVRDKWVLYLEHSFQINHTFVIFICNTRKRLSSVSPPQQHLALTSSITSPFATSQGKSFSTVLRSLVTDFN